MTDPHHLSAIALLDATRAELADIHRGRHYALWRQDTVSPLSDALAQVTPFSDVNAVWIYTGDGGCVTATPRFGDWAIDRLVEKRTSAEILDAFSAEINRNAGHYQDVSPVVGLRIDEPCMLADGVELVPEAEGDFGSPLHHALFQELAIPPHTALLRQSYQVTPAFVIREQGATSLADTSVTAPTADERERIRVRCRLACLLASTGAIELPTTILRPDRASLLVAGDGNGVGRLFAAHPLVSCLADAQAVARIYTLLEPFREIDSLARSIDRLGRARLATSPVDRALDLGIAAEIALMHDHSSANTEITHKIGMRAAWLLGHTPAEREAIFTDMKKLYHARSQAVHAGLLSSKSTVDLDAADRLVARVLLAVLERGSFPDWNDLTMGGDGRRPDGASPAQA